MSDELDRLLDQYRDGIIASVRLASMRSDGPDRKEREQAAIEAGAAVIARAAIIAAWEGREDARDAARYRWLRDKSANSVNGPFVMSAEPGRWGWIEGDKTDLEVDAAIAATAIKAAIAQVDAARTEGKGNG